MRITYIGQASGTSLHRIRALERLNHQVTVINPWLWLGRSRWISRWLHHAGGMGVGLLIDGRILRDATTSQPDLIWVDQGSFLGPNLIRRLRNLNVPIVNYTLDDPFNGRDAQRFRRYLKAVPYYDLLALVREENPSEATLLGARNVMQIWRSADEVAHRPRQLTADERTRYASDVCFIGTWMPERGPFMADLIKRGIPLAIWGDRWNKAPEWPLIAPHWRGPGVYADADYAGIIQSARISLGLLSKGNRDLHTQRSLEIPSLGGLLCAERTAEHLALYDEGKEAVFWQDAEECAEVCNRLLKNETLRLEIAQRGLERARRNNHFNEPVIATVIEQAMSVFGVMR